MATSPASHDGHVVGGRGGAGREPDAGGELRVGRIEEDLAVFEGHQGEIGELGTRGVEQCVGFLVAEEQRSVGDLVHRQERLQLVCLA
jgi:hypothetical protein